MRRLFALLCAMVMTLSLAACGSETTTTPSSGSSADTSGTPDYSSVEIPEVPDLTGTDTSAILGVEDGVLTVGMECAYAPYNWTQTDDSNGAVPIVNNPGSYANGYDVMMAKRICEAYGWELEVMAIGWDGLSPALNAGQLDAVIAGQSMHQRNAWLRWIWPAPTSTLPSSVCAKAGQPEQARLPVSPT